MLNPFTKTSCLLAEKSKQNPNKSSSHLQKFAWSRAKLNWRKPSWTELETRRIVEANCQNFKPNKLEGRTEIGTNLMQNSWLYWIFQTIYQQILLLLRDADGNKILDEYLKTKIPNKTSYGKCKNQVLNRRFLTNLYKIYSKQYNPPNPNLNPLRARARARTHTLSNMRTRVCVIYMHADIMYAYL